MSTSYKIKMKFANTDDASITKSLTVNNADSNVTKQTVTTFNAVRANVYTDTTVLAGAELISTTTTDLLED